MEGLEVLLVALAWNELDESRTAILIGFVGLVILGVVALQVIGVCVWRLLTMARGGTVFSFAAFRYVDVVIGSIAAGSVVVFSLAVLGAYSNRTTPGDEVAPGLVGLLCGLSLVIGGVALLVYVLRSMLVQAVALDDETKRLQAELSGVI